MDSVPIQIIALFLVSLFLNVYSNQLGSPCTKDKQCKIEDSQCLNGVCACKHYHAPLNNSKCLESKLLGRECVISEQCFLRVANSTCRDGQCQCSEGFTRFRKHTCLGPAQPGEVCYSDEHCQLYNKKSHCKFLIPKLFGKCICDSDGPCGTEASTKPSTEITTTEEIVENNKTEEMVTEGIVTEKPEEQTERNDWDGQNPQNDDNEFLDPFLHQKEHLQDTVTSPPAVPVTEEQLVEEEQTEILPTEGTTEVIQTTTEVQNTTAVDEVRVSSRPQTRIEILEKTQESENFIDWNDIKGVSLGYPCQSDLECQKNDKESRCIDNVCDCLNKHNKSEYCSSDNTGCGPETFQCRSSGDCISWFFVCDGRDDCPDKSDEECEGPKCPKPSFQCEVSGRCVSLAVLCDGVKNCPDGEDERFCLPESRNATQGCPEHTFQCANGQCLPKYEFCNATPKCSDGSDENPVFCNSLSRFKKSKTKYCPFKCKNNRCRSTAIVCSGKDGCGDNSDETQCSVCRCSKNQ